jgi:hypothetical protein
MFSVDMPTRALIGVATRVELPAAGAHCRADR